MLDLWEWLSSAKGQTAVAGAAGGLVRWLTLQDSWKSGLVAIVVGCICAIYLGPLVDPLFAPVIGKIAANAEASVGFSSFVVGLGGITVVGFIMDLWSQKRRSEK